MAIDKRSYYMLNERLNKRLQKEGVKLDLGAVYNGMISDMFGYAVDAARRGDNGAVEDFVNSIGKMFYSTEGADDPMWTNAAKAAFECSAFGLIEYYMEEDREMHAKAFREQWNPDILAQRLDELWDHVTLYNVYQMMVQLGSRMSNDADFIHIEDDDPSDEKDYLTLFFDATNALPPNKLRSFIRNQDNMLRSMAGSETTIVSVYEIALTAMRFFTDDKISRLKRANQPNFIKMVSKRVLQARKVKDAIRSYKDVYHKTDDDILRLNPEEFVKIIMNAVNEMIVADSKAESGVAFDSDDIDTDTLVAIDDIDVNTLTDSDAIAMLVDIIDNIDVDMVVDMDNINIMDNIDINMLVDLESQLLSDALESNAQANPDLQKLLEENGRILEKQ